MTTFDKLNDLIDEVNDFVEKEVWGNSMSDMETEWATSKLLDIVDTLNSEDEDREC